GGVAVSAAPPENVHAVDAEAERFDTVVGHTRLSFQLRFEYTSAADFACAEGFSFAYQTKTDQGRHPSSRDYMLVVTPKDAAGRNAGAYCLPAACLESAALSSRRARRRRARARTPPRSARTRLLPRATARRGSTALHRAR